MAGNPFDHDSFFSGQVTPVFFASALTNFGVEPFFDAFVHFAPPRMPRLDRTMARNRHRSREAPLAPMFLRSKLIWTKRHRDSMAFLRICSGKFERDMVVKHHRMDREVRLVPSAWHGCRRTNHIRYSLCRRYRWRD